MLREIITRVHCIFSKTIMCISARFTATATGPMFYHGVYTIVTPTTGNFFFTC